jgi:hypothetical protein
VRFIPLAIALSREAIVIEPDVRISRIRLSDWLHRKAYGKEMLLALEGDRYRRQNEEGDTPPYVTKAPASTTASIARRAPSRSVMKRVMASIEPMSSIEFAEQCTKQKQGKELRQKLRGAVHKRRDRHIQGACSSHDQWCEETSEGRARSA